MDTSRDISSPGTGRGRGSAGRGHPVRGTAAPATAPVRRVWIRDVNAPAGGASAGPPAAPAAAAKRPYQGSSPPPTAKRSAVLTPQAAAELRARSQEVRDTPDTVYISVVHILILDSQRSQAEDLRKKIADLEAKRLREKKARCTVCHISLSILHLVLFVCRSYCVAPRQAAEEAAAAAAAAAARAAAAAARTAAEAEKQLRARRLGAGFAAARPCPAIALSAHTGRVWCSLACSASQSAQPRSRAGPRGTTACASVVSCRDGGVQEWRASEAIAVGYACFHTHATYVSGQVISAEM